MKRLVWVLGLILFSSVVLAEVRINEIMYDPSGSDNNKEFVEVYSNEGDLSGWVIGDESSNDSLILLKQGTGDYYLIVEEGFDYSSLSCSIYSAGAAIGNGLDNDGEVISLYENNSQRDSTDYDNSKANGNGKTWEWTGEGWEESLVLGGSPCELNSKTGFSQDYSQIVINEFMPDPMGDDEADKPLGEWVELHNQGSSPIDLNGLVIYDGHDEHEIYVSDTTTISGTVIPANDYLVVYRNGDTDFWLDNDGFDKVRLFDGYPVNSSNLIDSVSYSGSTEGMSWSKISGSWYKSTATPGEENLRVDGCDWKVEVLPINSIFNSGQGVVWDVVVMRNYGESANLTVEGRVENIFGQVVKSYKPWTDEIITTTRTKTYTPNLPEDIYKIFFEITNIDCQDNDLNNNADFDLVVINPQYKAFDSLLEIEEIYLGNDEEAKWGDRLRVKVNIYKGDETKYNVELYAEKEGRIVSKRTKTSVFDKFKSYTLTLPVQLEPNCKGYYLDGDYELVLEGLEKEVRKSFKIKGLDEELCQEVSDVSEENQKFGYRLIDNPSEIKEGEDFEVEVELTGDSQDHKVKIISYVYRGSKHYSNEAVEEIELKAGEIRLVDLELRVDEADEGNYKLKVKINKDNQKTDKEITEDVAVKKIEEESECVVVGEELSVRNVSVSEKLSWLRKINEEGKIVYLSESKQVFEWVPIMIIGLLVLLSVILIFKKV